MKNQVDKVNHSPTADAVFDALHTVMHLYRSRRAQTFREDERDITHMESRVMDYFDRHPGATQSDLVLHSGKDKAQLTRLIRGLRDKGYLEAHEDERDRRSSRLHLSAEGKAIQQELKKCSKEVLALAVEGLTREQNRELVTLLKMLQANLEGSGKSR